jgi:hypothetical protein
MECGKALFLKSPAPPVRGIELAITSECPATSHVLWRIDPHAVGFDAPGFSPECATAFNHKRQERGHLNPLAWLHLRPIPPLVTAG